MKKDELLSKIQSTRQELVDLLTTIPADKRETSGTVGEWSVKDVVVHMNYWGAMLVTMLYQLRLGAPLTTLHFDPKLDVEAVNRRWYEMGKDRSWDLAWNDFLGLHRQILRRVAEFTEQELNDPHLNPKLRKRPLWEWIQADTYGHDEEHLAAIRAWLAQSETG